MAVKTVGALLVSPSLVLHLSWAGWPVSSKDPSVSATPVLALQLHATFKTSWDQTGPHMKIASTLLIEPFPQPLFIYLCTTLFGTVSHCVSQVSLELSMEPGLDEWLSSCLSHQSAAAMCTCHEPVTLGSQENTGLCPRAEMPEGLLLSSPRMSS